MSEVQNRLLRVLNQILSDPTSSPQAIDAALDSIELARGRAVGSPTAAASMATGNAAPTAPTAAPTAPTVAPTAPTAAPTTPTASTAANAAASATDAPDAPAPVTKRGGDKRSKQFRTEPAPTKPSASTHSPSRQAFYFQSTKGTAAEWRTLKTTLSATMMSTLKRVVEEAQENQETAWNEDILYHELSKAVKEVIRTTKLHIPRVKRLVMLQEISKCVSGFLSHKKHDIARGALKRKSLHTFSPEEWVEFSKKQKRDEQGRFKRTELATLLTSEDDQRLFFQRVLKVAGQSREEEDADENEHSEDEI